MLLKRNSFKYYFIYLLACTGDGFVEFLMNDVAKGKRVYLGRKKYTVNYCKSLFKELTTTKYLQRINKNGKLYYRLHPQADTQLKRDIPLLSLQKQKWDGYFRGIPYDFPVYIKQSSKSFYQRSEKFSTKRQKRKLKTYNTAAGAPPPAPAAARKEGEKRKTEKIARRSPPRIRGRKK